MNIFVNQLGYTPFMKKTAVLCGSLSDTLCVIDSKGEKVLSLPVPEESVELWGDRVKSVDFSVLTQDGEYMLTCGEEKSHPFIISKSPYDECLTALVDMFYYQRCGTALGKEVGVFAHPSCHDAPARIYGTNESIDVSGGWHDAGDYGRYIVPAAKAAADLMIAAEWNGDAFKNARLTSLLDEVRWELEWMLKMQRSDGALYHKVTCARFPAMVMPHEETEELIVCPVSTPATGDFAACMAMAARVYRDIDPDFADTLKSAARRAWDFLEANGPILFKNPKDIVTGEYGDGSDEDERMWAHAEMALTFGDEKYMDAFVKAAEQANHGCAILGWGDVCGYAAFAGTKLPGKAGELAKAWVIEAANGIASRLNAYGISMTERLPWGSNMNIANDGMVLYMAYSLTGNEEYKALAEKQVHYILGVNPVGYSYITGFGAQPVKHPHHRPSVATGVCQPGMLSGGAASGMMDPCAQKYLQGQPAGKSFIDHFESYSTNEICVYWNSPLVALIAGLIEA